MQPLVPFPGLRCTLSEQSPASAVPNTGSLRPPPSPASVVLSTWLSPPRQSPASTVPTLQSQASGSWSQLSPPWLSLASHPDLSYSGIFYSLPGSPRPPLFPIQAIPSLKSPAPAAQASPVPGARKPGAPRSGHRLLVARRGVPLRPREGAC